MGADEFGSAYSGFAGVYDLFMDDIPYAQWADYIEKVLEIYRVPKGLVLDLGCGTGSLSCLLDEKGYDMIGVDLSEEMLGIAKEKAIEENRDILYLNQDMREFELYGTVGAIVSVCDSLNYILEEEELLEVFRLVNNYLDPGGIFLFDLNTRYKYEELMGENTIAENRESCSFIWENYYDKEKCINEYNLTIYIEGEDGRYDRWEETHFERFYETEKIVELLEKAGMEFLRVTDEFTDCPPGADSQRIVFLAREKGK